MSARIVKMRETLSAIRTDIVSRSKSWNVFRWNSRCTQAARNDGAETLTSTLSWAFLLAPRNQMRERGIKLVTTSNTCAYCHDSNPVNHENGVAITYKSDDTLDVRVLLHKSCAAEWSKRFERQIPIHVSPVR